MFHILLRRMHTHINPIIVYTDGSYMKKGGIGLYFPNREHPNIAENYAKWCPTIPPTSHRCELVAIYRAIAICIYANKPAFIYSDSLTAVDAINGRCFPKKNTDLYDPMIWAYNSAKYPMSLSHVKAHTNGTDPHSLGNAMAHTLAVYGASSKHIY